MWPLWFRPNDHNGLFGMQILQTTAGVWLCWGGWGWLGLLSRDMLDKDKVMIANTIIIINNDILYYNINEFL